MSNPYGITQVDVPGLIGMHQQLRQQRLQDLYNQRKIQKEDRAIAMEEKKSAILGQIFGGGMKPTGKPSDSDGIAGQPIYDGDGTPTVSDGPMPTNPAPDQGVPPPTTPQAQTTAPNGLSINQDALRQYMALDPQGGMALYKFAHEASAADVKAATSRAEAMAVAASALQRVPAAQRGAELQKWSGWLVEHGVPAEMIDKADLSDGSLARYYEQGKAFKDVINDHKPDVRVLPPGATLYDMRGNRTVATNGAPPTLPADFDFDGGDGAGNGTGGFPSEGN